jgi:hypothetical protein
MAAPKWLCNMANAVAPIGGDVHKQVKGGKQVPCVTHSSNGAWNYSRVGISGSGLAGWAVRRLCQASNSAAKRMFMVCSSPVASMLISVLLYVGLMETVGFESALEFTARVVAMAAPKWLCNMANAVAPIGGDVHWVPLIV